MTLERAMEILDINHREHYESIEPVNEACEIGRKAIGKQIPKQPIICDEDCPSCGEPMNAHYYYCPCCGQALDWSAR